MNLFFPEKNICFMCEDYGRDIEGNLCSVCREKLDFIGGSSCSICGRKIEEEVKKDHVLKCRECIRHPHSFSKGVSPLSYTGEIKEHIYNFKYNNKPYMYKLFGRLMLEKIVEHDLENVDLVVPVPLYKRRERKRGYNQAELLASYIGKNLKIKMDSKNLIRNEHTKEQNKLDRKQRRENIRGAFALKEKNIFMQKKILLIDDIYTTGSTVDECAGLLLENGAGEVFVSTIAITPNIKEHREWDVWK